MAQRWATVIGVVTGLLASVGFVVAMLQPVDTEHRPEPRKPSVTHASPEPYTAASLPTCPLLRIRMMDIAGPHATRPYTVQEARYINRWASRLACPWTLD
jgi:hypothetical protein